jgi:two-component system, NtrC family, sensor histidine kinase HydH
MPQSFQYRIMTPIAGLSALLLASGGFGAFYVHWAYSDVLTKVSELLPIAEASMRLEHALIESRNRLERYSAERQQADLQFALEHIRGSGQHLDIALENDRSVRGSGMARSIQRDHETLCDRIDAMLWGFPNRFPQSELPRLSEQLSTFLAETSLPERAQQYSEFSLQQLNRAFQQSGERTRRAGILLWLLGLLGATAGLVGGFGVSRVLQQSLVELSLPVHDAAGRLSEVVGPIRITASNNLDELRTALSQLSEQVATAVNKLQEAQRDRLRSEQLAALGQLAAGLAHELRNPLTAMKTLVQAARQQGGGVALNDRDLEILEEEMTRLSGTLQTFLDYARPPKPHRQWKPIQDVVQSTITLAAPRAAQQEVTIETQFPDDLPPVHVDTEQIRQTLLNLLLNAFDAMPNGGKVEIAARVESALNGDAPLGNDSGPGPWLKLTIQDNGVGLPEALGEKVFEPFMSTKEAGTGLGLAICRQIVESHGGTIHAGSAEPQGAVFTLRLPCPRQPDAAEYSKHSGMSQDTKIT